MSDADVIKILIASDMHLGYAEKDPIRGEDSFNTFEEIFIKANEHQAHLQGRLRSRGRNLTESPSSAAPRARRWTLCCSPATSSTITSRRAGHCSGAWRCCATTASGRAR